MSATADIEAIAAIIGRETLGWSDTYKPHAKWPEDYTPAEKVTIKTAAIVVYDMIEQQRTAERESLKEMLSAYWSKGDGSTPPEFIQRAAKLCGYKLKDMPPKTDAELAGSESRI